MIKIESILKRLEVVDFIGSKEDFIQGLIPVNDESTSPNLLCWVSDKNIDKIKNIRGRTIICSNNTPREYFNPSCNYIVVANPRNEFRKAIEFFQVQEPVFISQFCQVSSTAKIGQNVSLGHNVVIEDEVIIGDDSVVGHNSVIKRGCVLGRGVKIGSCCVVGGLGFGYEKNENAEYVFIPHLGNVVIADNVEIGNCTAIDRAVLGSTRIGNNCKIDNLVHIAHGVIVGDNSLIIANAMVAGSVEIGRNSWIAPSSSILNGKKIGNDVLVGMGAVVLKDVNDSEIWTGNPAKFLKKNR